MKYLLKTLVLVLLFCFPGATLADESADSEARETSPPLVISGGIICDSLEQAVEQIDTFQSGDREWAEGCGQLVRPVLATVTLLGEQQIGQMVYQMAEFNFVGGQLPPQYGFWGPPQNVEDTLGMAI